MKLFSRLLRHTNNAASAGTSTRAARRAHDPVRAKPRGKLEPRRASDTAGGRGEFLDATYSNAHGRRDYRLYLPVDYAQRGHALPLVVMLHGCAHTPEDFAAGTRMNRLADEHGFLVAYPRQRVRTNRGKCWNWYRPRHQRAEQGEPAILAGMVRGIAARYPVDTARIFVAGLSAGASMAVILGRTCPDLFRAVGVHSGTPYASAHDLPSALATMHGHGYHEQERAERDGAPNVPMIVFHGDHDRVVAPVNADALVREAAGPDLSVTTYDGRVPHGHAYRREVYTDASGRTRLERWIVHGAGHAWSGGSADAMYTEPEGPDASAEMLRFFFESTRDGQGGSAVH